MDSALALSVDKKFSFHTIGITINRRHLTLTPLPVPMRQQMSGMLLIVPTGAIHIISVFRKTGKVADTEIAAAAWPVGIVRSRLAEIVITRPNELSYYPTVVVLHLPVIIGKIAP